jgi:zinc transport system substrate-binding protein
MDIPGIIHMNYKILTTTLLFLFFSNQIFAAKVVTSITPIASLVKMLTKDDIDVEAISIHGGCPDHYQASFSDLKKIENANLVIYIDDKFDKFAVKLMKKNSNLIKISDFKRLNIVQNKHDYNWHLWLDLDNALILLEELANILTGRFPELRENLQSNLGSAINKINALKKIKADRLKHLSNIIVASDSLEYLFLDKDYSVIKIFNYDNKNFGYLKLLSNLSNDKANHCVILSNDQNTKLYQKFTVPIIQIDSENWALSTPLEDLFYNKYLEIIDNLAQCTG